MGNRPYISAVAIAMAIVLVFAFQALAQDKPGVIRADGEAQVVAPSDRADALRAYNFDCNGTYDDENGIWWLATSNPFKFKKRFTGQWYFENVPVHKYPGGFIPVKMLLPSFTQHPSRGGRPNSSDVVVTARNPQTDANVEIKPVRIGFTREAIARPSYAYIPVKFVSGDGRLIIEVGGLGHIGVSSSRLVILDPK